MPTSICSHVLSVNTIQQAKLFVVCIFIPLVLNWWGLMLSAGASSQHYPLSGPSGKPIALHWQTFIGNRSCDLYCLICAVTWYRVNVRVHSSQHLPFALCKNCTCEQCASGASSAVLAACNLRVRLAGCLYHRDLLSISRESGAQYVQTKRSKHLEGPIVSMVICGKACAKLARALHLNFRSKT